MSSFPESARIALDFLKGKENPFDSLVRPQRLDDHFLDIHVPELLASERNLVLQIVDHYRVEEYTRMADLPATRVVLILGERGTGKTHLLQSLSYRDDGKSQIVVRPTHYDVNLPFEEYLLAQLLATLAAEDEVYRSRPIEDIAAALTRRLLRQTIRALGPTERFFALEGRARRQLRFFFGGVDKECELFERLMEALKAAQVPDLRKLIRDYDLKPEQCFRLVRGHLQRYEVGADLLSVLRRQLYAAMAQAALLQQNEPLFRLLEGEYTGLGTAASTRFEIVSRLLHALTEVCALVRQPIVFAFDNLERLFQPHGQFDGGLVRAFFNSLAQGVDNTRGLLILLFAETGLFELAVPYMDSFAQDRLAQGVPVFGKGPVSQVRLGPPKVEEIKVLLKGRVTRLLAKCPGSTELPEYFPFEANFLDKAASGYQSLRHTLQRLRDHYSARVYDQMPAEEKPPAVNWENLLETTWQEQLAAASRKLEGALASQVQRIHAGLGCMLEQLLPVELGAYRLTHVQTTASVGNHPTYGVVSLLIWQGDNATAPEGKDAFKVGVGFLLARGPGMRVDLGCKFDFFRRPAKGDYLLIFWPGPNGHEDPVEALPPATRAVWDESRYKKKATLRRVENNDLCVFVAFPEWLNAVQAAASEPVPPEVLQAFMKERFESFSQLIGPPVFQDERIVAHED
jgi:hypothetical protein